MAARRSASRLQSDCLILAIGNFVTPCFSAINFPTTTIDSASADDRWNRHRPTAPLCYPQILQVIDILAYVADTNSPYSKRSYTAMVKRSRDSSVASAELIVDEDTNSLHHAKLNAVEMKGCSPSKGAMQCSLSPHREPLDFASIEDFETHYVKDHSNRCTSCGKNFPTAHFLALHIDENHNTFREVLQAKGEKTYACFVEDCDKKCSTPQKRRLHLIDKHLFPKIYNFRIVDTGIDKSASMLQEGRRRRVSTADDLVQARGRRRRQSEADSNTSRVDPVPVPPESNHEAPSKQNQKRQEDGNFRSGKAVSDATISDLAASMSSLQFVPPSVASKQRNKPKS
ncbi:hypothetical protein EDD37DRAFT_605484 [Exophiala viscosa]|uniref:uncharacterized protein n=1 Tax=Exophiala viscosa TaxID=2486360 RepID=UPI0021955CFB|nr:hypothetical protein EDD37DRAFT_605484 [Exophiala viscosa]